MSIQNIFIGFLHNVLQLEMSSLIDQFETNIQKNGR